MAEDFEDRENMTEDIETEEKPLGYVFGRPTLYTEDMPERVIKYLEQCNDEWEEFHKTRGEKSDTFEMRLKKVKVPSREGFAIYVGVCVDTLLNWGDEHADFFGALKLIDQHQKERLFQEGLAGNYNPIIAKLGLSSNHGMRDKSDLTTDGEKVTKVSVEIVRNNGAQTQSN